MSDRAVGDGGLRLALGRVRRELHRRGLLLAADSQLPSVATIVAGAAVRGSWWGHPAGQSIYRTLEALEGDRDVLFVKLVRGKVTLVERRLWPAMFGLGRGREAWQMRGLSSTSRRLLIRLDRGRTFLADGLPPRFHADPKEIRDAIRELEARLLIVASSLHTSSGAHALKLESWRSIALGRGWKGTPRSPAASRTEMEAAIRTLAGTDDVRRLVPWPTG